MVNFCTRTVVCTPEGEVSQGRWTSQVEVQAQSLIQRTHQVRW